MFLKRTRYNPKIPYIKIILKYFSDEEGYGVDRIIRILPPANMKNAFACVHSVTPYATRDIVCRSGIEKARGLT